MKDTWNMTPDEARKYILQNWFDGDENVNSFVCGDEEYTTMAIAVEALEATKWHYPSKGEDIYNADLDWGTTYFLCQMKDGKLAIAFGCWDEDCEGNVSRNIDFCGENFDVLDTDDIYAWQYILPPKEEA